MVTKHIRETFLHYLTDSEGQRTAVVIDIDVWTALIEALEAQKMQRK